MRICELNIKLSRNLISLHNYDLFYVYTCFVKMYVHYKHYIFNVEDIIFPWKRIYSGHLLTSGVSNITCVTNKWLTHAVHIE